MNLKENVTTASLAAQLEGLIDGGLLKLFKDSDLSLLESLGRGPYGEVWSCQTPQGLRSLKILNGDVHDLSSVIAQLKAQIQLSLNASCLSPCKALVAVNNRLGLLTRAYHTSVQRLIDEEYPRGMPLVPGVELCLSIANALQGLHAESGRAHGLVKPSNVLVDLEEELTVKEVGLTDLGLAALKSSGAFEPAEADPRMHWASAEVLKREEPGTAADVYAAGLVFNFIFTGSGPWPEHFLVGHVRRRLLDKKTPPRVTDYVPAAVRPLLEKMTAWDKADRPTMKEVVAQLKDLKAQVLPSAEVEDMSECPATPPRDLEEDLVESVAVLLRIGKVTAALKVVKEAPNFPYKALAAHPRMNDPGWVLEASEALMLAAKDGDLDRVRLLVDGANAAVHHINKFHYDALHIACWANHLKVASFLLERGADPETTTIDGATPLYTCANKGHDKIAKLLIEHGSDLETPMSNSATPLYIACQEGHTKMVLLLLSFHANIETIAPLLAGGRPLHIAVFMGRPDIVRILVDHKADLMAQRGDGKLAVEVECGPHVPQEKHAECVSYLLSKMPKNWAKQNEEKKAQLNALVAAADAVSQGERSGTASMKSASSK